MKSVSTTIQDALKQSTAISSSQRVIVEWNQNRYATISAVTNGTTADKFPDIYSLESIADPYRPVRSGIVKSFSSSVDKITSIGADGYITKPYTGNPILPRYILASADSKYKYWQSPSESTGSYGSAPAPISNCAPQVLYADPAWANKIVVAFENSYSQPSAYTVQITTDGTNWTTVETNVSIPSDGRVVLYRQANGSWSTTTYRDAAIQIRGVRVSVTQMNKSKVYFNLIELSARLEHDISAFVKDWSIDLDISEHSFVAPLGKASSNTGSVALSNIDARFTNDNDSSPYKGLLGKGALVTIDVGISTDTYNTVSKTYTWIRMATMRSVEWTGQDRDGTTIELKDDAEYLQTVKPNPMFMEGKTIGQIIWQLLDSIGYNNYAYSKTTADYGQRVPYFWADGESSVWEIIEELTEGTQTAVYFDENGVLQIKTRQAALDLTKSVAWQLDAVNNSPKLADVISNNRRYEYSTNKVNVGYRNTRVSDDNNGSPAMEVVWEPEDDVVLRSSPLNANMNTTQTTMKITPDHAKLWPFSGAVQIEGEYIQYEGKEYKYYLANGTMTQKYIKSEDERQDLDELYPLRSFQNYYTGYLKIIKRGYWNSFPRNHVLGAGGYNKFYRKTTGSAVSWGGGFTNTAGSSIVRLRTNSTFTTEGIYSVYTDTGLTATPIWFGTRVRFPSSGAGAHNIGGLIIAPGSNTSGWLIELSTSKLINSNLTASQNSEINLRAHLSGGTYSKPNPGARMQIDHDKWYDVDVTVIGWGANFNVSIYIDGVRRVAFTMPQNYGGITINKSVGVFVRGDSLAEFEYVYADAYDGAFEDFDESTYFDRIQGGYVSDIFSSKVLHRMNSTWNPSSSRNMSLAKDEVLVNRGKSLFIDDFGPFVHEVREFDVNFSKSPVLYSRLYFSNESQILNPQYNGDPFGSKFVLANKWRNNAVVNGEDTLTFGTDNPVTQKLFVYGRVVTQDDEKMHTVKNDAGIRRNGEISLDITSPWIQSEDAAKAIGEWIIQHWGDGCEELSSQVFGNPLLQLTDVVSVNDPVNGMAPSTHKYFVVGINHSYKNGLETTLTLRRAAV